MTEADRRINLCIDKMQSFVLDAGAGSGKTRSLIEALRYLIDKNGTQLACTSQKIACITFTNAAANEIVERTGHNPLIQVSTIHDFLWSVLKPHQKALKQALLQHNETLEKESSRKRDSGELAAAIKKVDVSYSDRGPEFLEGRLFHDDLIDVGLMMFQLNPMLSKIVAARNPFILVDEYQDTSHAVISILLDHVLKASPGRFLVGFFGDKFQNIYHGGAHPGVGEIPPKQSEGLTFITKEENYRCSEAVIAVLNQIRVDIKQTPAGKNVQGSAVYIHVGTAGDGIGALTRARTFVQEKLGWDLAVGTQKELFLTHKLIAKKAGYERLLDVYQKRGGFFRDRLLNGEDKFIGFFQSRIEPLIAAWQGGHTGNVLSILRAGGFKLTGNDGKTRAKHALDTLSEMRTAATIRELLVHVNRAGLVILIDDLKKAMDVINGEVLVAVKTDATASAIDAEREAAEREFYLEFMETPYAEVSGLCRFLDEHTPFSTKHGVKGTEFDTVFVVLDDKGARWNQYSFDKYLDGEDEAAGKTERAHRTRNLFYVSCSRAKKNLAVIDLGTQSRKKDTRLRKFFGAQNCFSQ